MTSTDGPTAVAAHVAKWRVREPEMAFAEVFCPRALRWRFALWGALVNEWRHAAFELSDARPTEAKCSWWADEALRCAQGMPRHPLTVALAAPDLPWAGLAEGLQALAQDEPRRPVDRDAAVASVAPLAGPLATLEGALFAHPAGADARRSTAVHLLGDRLRGGFAAPDGARVPLSLLARHGLVAAALDGPEGRPAVRDWAAELLALAGAEPVDAPLYRRARSAFDRWLLESLAAGRPQTVPPLRALRLAWRAARRMARKG